jgi:hypothetical protein
LKDYFHIDLILRLSDKFFQKNIEVLEEHFDQSQGSPEDDDEDLKRKLEQSFDQFPDGISRFHFLSF